VQKPHPLFVRVENNLIHNVSVSLRGVLCGFYVDLKMLDGSMLHRYIEDVFSKGMEMRIPDYGMHIMGAFLSCQRKTGDLIVKISVIWPMGLSYSDRQKLKEILPP
jgi:DnaJ family protein B protein 4